MEHTYSAVEERQREMERERERCEEAIERLKPFSLAQESGPVEPKKLDKLWS